MAPTATAFDRLLADPVLLRIWQRFVRLSEQDQAAVLAHMEALASPSRRRSPQKPAPGAVPPSPERCYARIPRSVRDILRRSSVSPVRAAIPPNSQARARGLTPATCSRRPRCRPRARRC